MGFRSGSVSVVTGAICVREETLCQAYEWTGDVDEMLRDFSHYVFRFHDQFVEALSSGIWFETFEHSIDDAELSATRSLGACLSSHHRIEPGKSMRVAEDLDSSDRPECL